MKGFLYSFYKVPSCVLMPGFGFVLFLVDYLRFLRTLFLFLSRLCWFYFLI